MNLSGLKNKDYFWWSTAFIIGALVWSVPSFLHGSNAPDTGVMNIIVILILLFFGALAGLYSNVQPWKLALASILALPVIELSSIAFNLSNTATSFSLVKSIPYMMFKIPVYVLQGLPVLIGSFFGSMPGNRNKKTVKVITKDFKNKTWWRLYAAGFLAGIFYNLATPKQPITPFPYILVFVLVFILVGAAFVIGYFSPLGASRWAVAEVIGFASAVVCRILIDLIKDSASHNLFPFEIVISFIIALPCAFAGVYLGVFVKLISSKKSK